MNVERLPGLQKLVESVFGKKILSNKDCLELQTEIYRVTSVLLSTNTLRRFFGLIRAQHMPSLTTLNALARYCGYNAYEEWLNTHQQHLADDNPDLLQYMIAVFRDTRVQAPNDPTYLDLAYHTIRFLQRKPELAEAFQQAIAKTRNGQNFYFEPFVNTDRLNGFYGNGLRHYLAAKRTGEAQIFGHALLAKRYWLTAEDGLCLQHCTKALAHEAHAGLHPFVAGRYFGSHLFLNHLTNVSNNTVFQEARAFYNSMVPPNDSYVRFPGFELTFGISLVFVGEWQEALDYLDTGIKRLKKDRPPQNLADLLQSFCVFKATALAGMGQQKEAIQVFGKIDPTRFYFLTKQLNTILYLQTGIRLKRLKPTRQLEHLVQETGFVRLLTL